MEPGTINQIETFHKWLVSDLFKRNKDINYEKCLSDENISKTKKYYIVPLKIKKDLIKDDLELKEDQIIYEIDKKLLKKVELLSINGYKNE